MLCAKCRDVIHCRVLSPYNKEMFANRPLLAALHIAVSQDLFESRPVRENLKHEVIIQY